MDIKLKSNDNGPNPKEEAFIDFGTMPEKTKRPRMRTGMVFFILSLLFLSCFLVLNMTTKRANRLNPLTRNTASDFVRYFDHHPYYSEYEVRDQIIRYAKNIQRYFVYYHDFIDENAAFDESALTESEVKYKPEALLIDEIIAQRELAFRQLEMHQQTVLDTLYIFQEYAANPDVELGEIQWNETDAYELDEQISIFGDLNITVDMLDKATKEAYYYWEYYENPVDVYLQNYDLQWEQIAVKYENMIEEIANTDSYIMEEQNMVNFHDVRNYLAITSYLNYYIVDAKTNKVYTNIKDADDIETYLSETTIKYPLQDELFQLLFNNEFLTDSFYQNGLTGYIIVPERILQERLSSDIYGFHDQYAALQSYYQLEAFAGVVQIILMLLTFITAFLALLLERGTIVINMKQYRKIYAKLPLILKAACLVIALYWCANVSYNFEWWWSGYQYATFLSNLVFYGVTVALSIFVLLLTALHGVYLIFHLKEIGNEPEIKRIRTFFSDFIFVFSQNNASLSGAMLLLIVTAVLSQLAIVLIIWRTKLFHMLQAILLIEPVIVVLCFMAFYLIVALSRVHYYTDEIIAGKLDEIEMERGFFKSVILKLNLLRGGVKRVIVERNKSDRLKTELIANVSHDLKTPLTSIINYVELLKNEQLGREQKESYIAILESKAQRLKVLIDDLFEATKLSSGQIELEREHLNIVALIRQTLGELSEQIDESGILFKFSNDNEQIDLFVDGRKLWRVFENLIINIIKYSQVGTRAYISVVDEPESVEITFKSTSNYEMNMDADELFERFKRGDESRATEGSGLGLSIARDIIELHGGTMKISIDGDLFKVIIVLLKG